MTAKRILVLGATGGTCRHVVSQALQQGHEITVLVRNPKRLEGPADRVRVLVGSVIDDDEALAGAVRDQDAVVSTLGIGSSLKPNGLIARAVPAIVHAMKVGGVRRLIFTSAYGVGQTFQGTPLLPRVFIRTLLRDIYADKAAGERELRRIGDDIDWTVVYPVTLTNGARTGRYRVGEHVALRGLPKISRADVADCLLAIVDETAYVKKGILVAS